LAAHHDLAKNTPAIASTAESVVVVIAAWTVIGNPQK
jgi:hypothetical protein